MAFETKAKYGLEHTKRVGYKSSSASLLVFGTACVCMLVVVVESLPYLFAPGHREEDHRRVCSHEESAK